MEGLEYLKRLTHNKQLLGIISSFICVNWNCEKIIRSKINGNDLKVIVRALLVCYAQQLFYLNVILFWRKEVKCLPQLLIQVKIMNFWYRKLSWLRSCWSFFFRDVSLMFKTLVLNGCCSTFWNGSSPELMCF